MLKPYDTSAEERMLAILTEAFPGQFRRDVWLRAHRGTYCPDFLQIRGNLAIEVDGSIHERKWKQRYDRRRTRHLNGCGYYVIRFWNSQVLDPETKTMIVSKIRERMSIRRPATTKLRPRKRY